MKISDKSEFECEVCTMGKMTQSFNWQSDTCATIPLELVHCDLCGPIQPVSKNGLRYAISFVDDFSGASIAYFLHQSIVYDYVQWKSDVSGGISQNEPVIATQSVTQNTNVNDGVHTQNASNSETTRRYPKRDTCRPKGLNDYVLENDSVNVAVHYCYTMHDIPTTYSEVVSSPKS